MPAANAAEGPVELDSEFDEARRFKFDLHEIVRSLGHPL